MIERVDRITTPLVVGRAYLVQTVHFRYFSDDYADWPVMGHKHTDVEFFNFKEPHFHVDARFLSQKLRKKIGDSLFSAPLAKRIFPHQNDELPVPFWKKWRCRVSFMEYPFGDRDAIQGIRMHYSGQQCAKGKGGWICPHRKAALGSILPDENGLVTCPLHGLVINAETGIVV